MFMLIANSVEVRVFGEVFQSNSTRYFNCIIYTDIYITQLFQPNITKISTTSIVFSLEHETESSTVKPRIKEHKFEGFGLILFRFISGVLCKISLQKRCS